MLRLMSTVLSRWPLLALAALLCLPLAARAQDNSKGTKVGVVNVNKVFLGLNEAKEFTDSVQKEGKDLDREAKQKQDEIDTLQNDLKNLQVGSPQYDDKTNEILKKRIDLDGWYKLKQAYLENRKKRQVMILFKKIQEAVLEVAQGNGIDLVIDDQSIDPPSEDITALTFQQLNERILRHNILYAAHQVDLTDKVVFLMNSKK